jgi:cell division protease FtsH
VLRWLGGKIDMSESWNKKNGKGRFEKKDFPGKNSLVPRNGPFNLIFIAVAIMVVMLLVRQLTPQVDTLRYDEFVSHLRDGHIEKVILGETDISGQFKQDWVTSKGQKAAKDFVVTYRSGGVLDDDLKKMLSEQIEKGGLKVEQAKERIWLWNLFLSLFFPLAILGFFIWLMFARNLRGGGGGMLMSFGRSKHRLHDKEKVKITFEDVAGIDEAKDEVAEIIEFLRNPKKFQRLGGRIPRGVLLVGPPGCGKTLLAKAIAGEADVPFFSISGSDFVEMFVGVGASRVRDLFKQAKDNSPCIIFLDEIDAVGRRRSASFAGGGHDEREQTLNAILVEMDGFDTDDQVIVMAATNRSDILDSALTRPGRFDRQVVVPLPDLKGRAEILRVHAKKVKLGPDVNLERAARGTPMFSGADLAAIINEAALAATMANKDFIESADLEEARDKVRWGRAKKSRVVDQMEREITAYHEAGHTLVQAILKDADPLHKVSIIPRGPMGGATFALPEKDRTLFTKRYCMALLQVCFGGRIAEEMFCEDISSGAQSDIQQATRIAKQMVLTWGMSERLGAVSYETDSGLADAFYGLPAEKEYSEKTAEIVDMEVKRITDEAFNKARELIEHNRDNVEHIAKALLKYETLDAEDVKIIIAGGSLDKPTVADLLAAEHEKSKKAAEENK